VGSIDDWDTFLKSAYDSLKPGGWVQSFEPSPQWESDDDSIPEDTALKQWGRFFVEGGRKFGRSFTVVDDGLQRKSMESAGFVDIDEYNIKVRCYFFLLSSLCPRRKGTYVHYSNPLESGPPMRSCESGGHSSGLQWSEMPRAWSYSLRVRWAGRRRRFLFFWPSSGVRCAPAGTMPITEIRSCGAGSPNDSRGLCFRLRRGPTMLYLDVVK
jgi:hypothetical protein